MANLVETKFGGLRLFVTRIATARPRTQVRHGLSDGDDHVVQDRGRGLFVARCSVIFAHMRDDELEPLERLQRLLALVDDKPRLFSHPLEGDFLARVGPFEYTFEATGTYSAEIEFVAVSEMQQVTPAGAGGIPASGEGAVAAAAESLGAELAGLGIESSVVGDATTMVDGWASNADLNPRDVYAQTGSLTSSLAGLAGELELDLGMWPAYKAAIVLNEAIRAAAEAVTADVARTFLVRIGEPIALNALLATIYGADEVDLRRGQVLKLNDIANPAWLEPGTDLLLPAARPTGR